MYKVINISDYTKKEYDLWYSVMSADKQKRVDSYAFEKDKRATVFGDMLARKMLSDALGKPPAEIVILIGEKGKPYVKDSPYGFSISHSGDYVLCAVSHGEVGADIEMIREQSDGVIRRVCTVEELSYVLEKGLSANESRIRFIEIWTRKEAYFKCLGTGLGALKSVNTLSSEISGNMKTERADNYIISVFEKP